ncbi:MAG: hypothetical protein AMXMBFR23_16820 [Chloroflexota bacterium]
MLQVRLLGYQGKMTSARADVPVAMNAAATKAEATVVVMKRRMAYSRDRVPRWESAAGLHLTCGQYGAASDQPLTTG